MGPEHNPCSSPNPNFDAAAHSESALTPEPTPASELERDLSKVGIVKGEHYVAILSDHMRDATAILGIASEENARVIQAAVARHAPELGELYRGLCGSLWAVFCHPSEVTLEASDSIQDSSDSTAEVDTEGKPSRFFPELRGLVAKAEETLASAGIQRYSSYASIEPDHQMMGFDIGGIKTLSEACRIAELVVAQTPEVRYFQRYFDNLSTQERSWHVLAYALPERNAGLETLEKPLQFVYFSRIERWVLHMGEKLIPYCEGEAELFSAITAERQEMWKYGVLLPTTSVVKNSSYPPTALCLEIDGKVLVARDQVRNEQEIVQLLKGVALRIQGIPRDRKSA